MMKFIKILSVSIFAVLIISCRSMQADVSNHSTKNEESARLNVQLGMAYLEHSDMVAAKSKFNKALKQAPNLPLVHYAQGFYHQRTGNIDYADKAFRYAISLAPGRGEGHNNYGTFLCNQGRFQQAEKEFLLAVKDTDYLSTAQSYENAGICSLKHNEPSKAKFYFKQALEHDPRALKALVEMAALSYADNDYEQANQYLKRYRSQQIDNSRTLLLSIQVAKKLGKDNLVASQALLLRNEFPNSPEAKKVQEILNYD